MQKNHLATAAAKLLKQDHLISILTSQAIGAENGNHIEGVVHRGIAQAIQSRTIKAGAAVALVFEDMFRQ